MKALHYIIGILATIALMITLLITSVEAVAYWTPGYYEKEYEKYHVTEAVRMEMNDLLDVTHEMMEYLRGDRENLQVQTIVDGQPREFFNQREIAHMEDVRGLFLSALTIRRTCIAGIILAIVLLLILKADMKKVLPHTICAGTLLFLGIAAVLAGIISTDFTRYFIIFHEIFFQNDLWILDPTTDLLINIVPEPFFVDAAAHIGLTFGLAVLLVFVFSIFFRYRYCKKKLKL